MGFEVPEATKSYDLARSCTSVNLAARSVVRKFLGCAQASAGIPPRLMKSVAWL